MRSPTCILVYSSYPFIASNLAALLGEAVWPDMDFTLGQAHSLAQLTAYLTTHPATIVLADIDAGMPEITRMLRSFPHAKFVALSMFADMPVIKRCISHGAKGFLLKTSPLSEFEEALRTVAAGRLYFTGSIPLALLKQKTH